MNVEFDDAKRDWTLLHRGLDFSDAIQVFSGQHFTAEDMREDSPEQRFITAGMLAGRMVVMVWTQRGRARRIISMRKANEREKTRYAAALRSA